MQQRKVEGTDQGEGDVGQDVGKAKIEEWLTGRQVWTEARKTAENAIKDIDSDIKLHFIQNNIQEYRSPEQGMRLKLAVGHRESIDKKKMIQALHERGYNPDEIKRFLDAVMSHTEYDYVDMRPFKAEE